MSLHRMDLERRPRYHALKVVQLIDLMQKFLTDVEGHVYTPMWIKGYVKGRRELLDEMLKDAKRDLSFEEDQLGMKRDPRPSEAQAIRLTAEDKKKIAEAKPRCTCGPSITSDDSDPSCLLHGVKSGKAPSDVQHKWLCSITGVNGCCACGWPTRRYDDRPGEPVLYHQWKQHARAAAKRGEIVDLGT